MKQLIATIVAPHIAPSVKGSAILLTSWMLDVVVDYNHSWLLYLLSILLTCLGIYDYALKIRWKHRKERERREEEDKERREKSGGHL